jgi:hypothetical protein
MTDLRVVRLACPVAAEKGDHLAPPHLEVDAVKRVRLAIPGVQVPHVEERAVGHRAQPSPWPM